MKKVLLLIAATSLFLCFSCKDNVMETLEEPQDEEQIQEESQVENPNPDKFLFSIEISKVTNLQDETIQPENLIDLVLCIITPKRKVPVATWTNYTKMTESVFSIPEIQAGTYEFELQGSYEGKAYKGTMEKQIQANTENKISLELVEQTSVQPTDKCSLSMNISVQGYHDLPIVYVQKPFCVQFTAPYETANWFVDSKKIKENSETFTFYPRTLNNETYTITVTDETEGYRSTNVIVQIQMPVDFRIASTEFYNTIANLDDSHLKDIYYIQFTDSDPVLYEITRTLNDFENINFALDFSECTQLSVLPYKIPDPQNPRDEEANLPFLADPSNVYGLVFGDNDITVNGTSLQYMPNLEYLVFGDGNNTIKGSAMLYGNPSPLKYLVFGNGNNTFDSCCLPSESYEFISFGNGTNTLANGAFASSKGSPKDCYIYFGKGKTIINECSLPWQALHIFIEGGDTTFNKSITNTNNRNSKVIEVS